VDTSRRRLRVAKGSLAAGLRAVGGDGVGSLLAVASTSAGVVAGMPGIGRRSVLIGFVVLIA
jgi:hypothetical protein